MSTDEKQGAWDQTERRKFYGNTGSDVIYARLETLQGDVSDLKTSVNALCDSINRLAVIEERIAHHREATKETIESLRKVVEHLEKEKSSLEGRIVGLERSAASNLTKTDASARWIELAFTAVVSGAGAYVIALATSGASV